MVADTTSIRCENFGNAISIIENLSNIQGTVQDRDRNMIKALFNKHYVKIATERNWSWRKFDRSFVFKRAITTGTVAVTNNSREVVFTGLTISNVHIGRSIRITGDEELYRIIGVDTDANSVFIETTYVGTTDATATYKMYQYEFPLPPDCDNICQIYIDSPVILHPGRQGGELDYRNNLEFNRALSGSLDYNNLPLFFTRDGKINHESYPVLDEMILDYDFLAGELYQNVDRLRVFPIEPDRDRVMHLNYAINVEPLVEDDDVPIMPQDDIWVILDFVLADWHRKNGSNSLAGTYLADARKGLEEMRSEFKKTDIKPKFVVDYSRFTRRHDITSRQDIFYASRQGESS